ncbi:MAG: diguanylate cyclase [Hormoscilla sp. GM7CHS1pb]|nr:diguanylate cyclase [Hormoscilla sp. GM7CHS1pb]
MLVEMNISGNSTQSGKKQLVLPTLNCKLVLTPNLSTPKTERPLLRRSPLCQRDRRLAVLSIAFALLMVPISGCPGKRRYGREEFAVILPDTDAKGAAKVLNEIREGFAKVRQLAQDNHEFSVTFSCGVSAACCFSRIRRC